MKKKGFIFAAAAMMAIGMAACGNQNSSDNTKTSNNGTTKPINWMETTELVTLDPSKASDSISQNTLQNTNQGLLININGSTVKPGVAKDYSVSKDGKTYTFNLRHSKWSDGSEVTAQDFVYGMQRTVNPKTASQTAYDFDHVENYDAVRNGKMPLSSLGVKAVGKYKLVIKLSQPEPYFKYLITGSDFFPQKEAFVKKYGSKYGTSAQTSIYNGPYKVTNWNGTNESWTLVKNNEYWNADHTKIQKVKVNVEKDSGTAYNEYQSGKLDEMMLSTKQQVDHYKNSPEYHQRSNSGTYYVELNQKKVAAFRNMNIRKALSMIINRAQFTNDVMGDGSFPAKGAVGKGVAKYNGKDFTDAAYVKDAVSYNEKEAKALFAKGLKQIGKKSISATITYDDTPLGKSVNEFLQSAFQKLPGFKVNTQNVPQKTRMTRAASGQFDITVAGWQTNYPDPMAYLKLFTKDNPYNFGKWNNAAYNQYVNAAETTDANNPGKRWDDMIKAQKILMDEQGIIPFYQRSQPQVMKTNIKGIGYSPTGAIWNFTDAYLTK
ncbi:peptide ABC transporter substrate-binding protein [Nicoliella lavandulae]|uniref:Peptide ABC transporter substrate-binding protein n=1 Tax=Nicoliella lavandulae TaxID=3082954 RepID=A0ABU8SJ67_9LACO